MGERIDIHDFDRSYPAFKEKIRTDQDILPENRKFILSYLRDAELGKTIKNKEKKDIGAGRNYRVAGILVRMSKEWFKKPFDEVTVKEMEDFILALNKGQVKSAYGRPYKSESLMTIKKFIRKFWKWLKGDNIHYPPEVDWISTSGKKAEITALKGLRESIEKMHALASTLQKKAIVMVLFDSGARMGEFLNLRVGDVGPIAEDDPELKGHLAIRILHSKTFGRPVGLPIATPALRQWLAVHPGKNNPESPLWVSLSEASGIEPMSKNYLAMFIARLGKKALGVKATCQMIRHTSATYYAPKLDRATYCRRFGWSYRSSMPDRYIDWSKMQEVKTVKVETQDEISKMKRLMRAQDEELSHLKEQAAEQREMMARVMTLVKGQKPRTSSKFRSIDRLLK